jgi:hypothetical protein
VKGTSGNSIFVMIARHFRTDDCTDAEGRATQDAQAEGESLCGINDRLSTKITKRAREKWISGGALKLNSSIYGSFYWALLPSELRAKVGAGCALYRGRTFMAYIASMKLNKIRAF